MQPVLDSLPPEWEKIVWNNDTGRCSIQVTINDKTGWAHHGGHSDLSVYGRYAAIEYASHDLIYVQDDDVIVSDPQAIVDRWLYDVEGEGTGYSVVANMPQEFRHDGYTDSCLVGFGSCFHRDLPQRAFSKYAVWKSTRPEPPTPEFLRTCDVVFTTLTPRVLVDVPKTDREMASDPNRMWKQPGHVGGRTRMLELARQVRDA
jgi:hypothetical protein